jgi:tetratricopeptide (TPR) repeat protein
MAEPAPARTPAPRTPPQGLSPAAVEATLKLALTRHQAGQLALAAALYDQVLLLDPGNVDALHLKGMAALGSGAADEALALLERACAQAPQSALIRRNSAEAYAALARWEDAYAALRAAIALKPDWAEPHAALGILYARTSRRKDAKAAFARATALDPAFAEAWNNLGVLHLADKEIETARAAFESAIKARPAFTDALKGLGVAHTEAGRIDAALTAFDNALAAPGLGDGAKAELLMNRATALHTAARWTEALSDLQAATALSPGLTAAWRNMAKPLIALGRVAEADAACTRALTLDPASDLVRYERAFARLLTGDIAGGFDDYRARPTVDRAKFSKPARPLPNDLTGRRLRLATEQGLGEHLFFLRYAPLLVARGAELATEVDPKLRGVIEDHPALGRLIDRDEPTPDFETVAIGDLPFLLGNSTAPAPLVLRPDPATCRDIGARLATLGPAPYVALTWRAGIQDGKSLSKTIPLEALAAPFRGVRATLVSIQRGPAPGETDDLARSIGHPVHDLSGLNDDLARMMALLALVDDYIGVSNTNMHLRAGLGLPARVLVPHPPEFRWLAAGDRSPWFPAFRLYRAAANGWDEASARLAADLARLTPPPYGAARTSATPV